jgi:hypothetical protein
VDTTLRRALGERDSGVQPGERVRSEHRSTIPDACFGFIADSLFRSTLIGLCKKRGCFTGILGNHRVGEDRG